MNKVDAKLRHFQLNLDYPYHNFTIDNQSNLLINYEINNFIKQFKEIDNQYVVLEFKNDNISLIAYQLLKIIQNAFNFPLLIYGKKKALKPLFKKSKHKEKFISMLTLKRLKAKNKAIIVSAYNPIYQVINKESIFKNLMVDYYICKSFTPQEIKTVQSFYAIENNTIDLNMPIIEAFAEFCEGTITEYFNWGNFSIPNEIQTINILKLTGNNEKDNEIVNQVVHKNELIFYHLDKPINDYPMLTSSYQFFLENKSNIAGYWNVNEYDLCREICAIFKPVKLNFVGDFSDEEKEMWV